MVVGVCRKGEEKEDEQGGEGVRLQIDIRMRMSRSLLGLILSPLYLFEF